MLALGIPSNPIMALMMGALIIQGITPGPDFMVTHPPIFWGVIASMWVGNLMLLVLNLPLIGLWVKLLTVPQRALFPAIVAFASVGVYSVNTNGFDLLVMAIFGFVGYLMTKLDCEPAPLLLGFVLGPDDRGVFPTRHGHLPGRRHGLRPEADQRRHARPGCRHARSSPFCRAYPGSARRSSSTTNLEPGSRASAAQPIAE